jgi:L-asparaginase II
MSSINPVLATTTRSGLIETQFRGSVSIVDEQGKELFALGHPNDYVYPRSALKYFQVLPLLASGAASFFDFSDQEIAVMCASHNAEQAHLETVENILKKTGLSAQELACGAHRPLGQQAADDLIAKRLNPTDLHNNCSGKHAGFLALALFLQNHLDTYLDPNHIVQRQIRTTIADYCGIAEEDLHMGMDGCSAPNYAMPLRNLAWGMARLVAGYGPTPAFRHAAHRVFRAATQNPFFIAGTGRYCTDLMTAAQGSVLAKLGADGVYLIGIPEYKIGIAIKMDDGSTGPQYQVSQKVLSLLEIISPEAQQTLQEYACMPIWNCNGIQVGERKAISDIWTGLSKGLLGK